VSLVVVQIWRYPIKSMGGEQLELSFADGNGLRGDRVWAVQDDAGKLGSGKDSHRFTRMLGLLDLSACYLDETEPPVVMAPDGGKHPVATGAADTYLQALTGRSVHVRRDTGVMHFDEVPFSLVGTATLDWLASQVTVAVDARRLRPNIVVRTKEPFAEEEWLDRRVRIGDAEAVFDRVFMRCVMVGMAQPGLPAGNVLKQIGRQRGTPCLAIGGHIGQPGTIHVGDEITVR
jgi:MOSC domain-containing protein